MSINKITFAGQIPTSTTVVIPASSSVAMPVGQYIIVPQASLGLSAVYNLPSGSSATSTLNIGGVQFSDGQNYYLTNSTTVSITAVLINV